MKLLHTMLRVKDLAVSIQFYQDILGMRLLRKLENDTGRFTLAFLGYSNEQESTVIELTHNWDNTEAYNIGNAYGHIAIEVDDVYGFCDKAHANGVTICRPAGPMAGSNIVLAFIEDPDGYKIEILGAGKSR
ncbi:MAG: lactoylglutathione lyase [Alphaproteobacteria bacterium]|jgi:lactoylglutathione lyase